MMAETFYIKYGDSEPWLEQILADAAGVAVDLSGSTARLHLRAPGAVSVALDEDVTLIDPNHGVVRYAWPTPVTLEPGIYYGEWRIRWADGALETFPNDSYFYVVVLAALV